MSSPALRENLSARRAPGGKRQPPDGSAIPNWLHRPPRRSRFGAFAHGGLQRPESAPSDGGGLLVLASVDGFHLRRCERRRREIIRLLALHPAEGLPHRLALVVESPGFHEAGDEILLFFGQGVTHARRLDNYWRK